MADQSDADVARRLHDALGRGDLDEISSLLDPDVQWHVPGSNPRSGTYAGREATMGLQSSRRRASTSEVLDVLVGEHYVMVFVQHRAVRDGVSWVGRFVHVLSIRAGRVVESWHFDEDQGKLDEFLNQVHAS
jgi:ketosteroid isomerase-like protein